MFEQRYMADVPYTERVVAWQFEPVEAITAAELNDDTIGWSSLVTRDEPGDVWGPPKLMGKVAYDVFVATVERDGFTEVEVVQTTGEDFVESRDDERRRIARTLAIERYQAELADDIEVDEDGAVESVDGGYWVEARVWVDADQVEERLGAGREDA